MIQRPPNMSGGLMPRPGGPPPYIRGPSPMMNQGSPSMQPNQGPSPAGQYAHSPSNQMLPSPGGMTPSPGPHGPGVPHGSGPHGPTSNSLAPSPSSGVNTPIGPPASQEDREYLDKVKQLEKYIEPLRRMIMKIGNEDQDKLAKMKKLLDILSNPDKRMPLGTLLKCEDVLKRMALDTVEPESEPGQSTSSLNPLLEAVIKIRTSNKTAPLNHSLSRTFLPPLQAVVGPEISLPPLPPTPPPQSGQDEDVPDVLQGEIARLDARFKVWLDGSQPTGAAGTVELVCQLDDKDLPAVPHINVVIPRNYPVSPPICSLTTPDYLSTPFLQRVCDSLIARLDKLPSHHTLSQLLTAWELAVRAACSPGALPVNNPPLQTLLMGV